jgi:DNA-binding XRE family transcriptional regulator
MQTTCSRGLRMPPKKDLNFGPRLMELRLAAAKSRYELAVAAGLHPNSIYQLEVGTMRPTWDTMRALADALGVTPDAFTVKAKPAKPRRPRKGGE